MSSYLKFNGIWHPSTMYIKANGAWKLMGSNSGGSSVEFPYQEACALVGINASSLHEVLTNNEYCIALAQNAEAYGILRNNYYKEMVQYIESYFSDGLNLLNFKCGFDCYLYKPGNQCTNVSGGWTYGTAGTVDGSTYDLTNSEYMFLQCNSGGTYDGRSPGSAWIYNKTALNFVSLGFTNIQTKYQFAHGAYGNVGGNWFAGTVSSSTSTSSISGNDSRGSSISTSNSNTVLADYLTTADDWSLTADATGYVKFYIYPRYQLGAFGDAGKITVTSVKLIGKEPIVNDGLIVYENGVLYDENVKTAGSYLTVNWNDGGQLSFTTYDSAWGGHWYLYGFTKPEGYSKLNILISNFTANDTRPWVRMYAQDTLNTSAQSINHNGNYSTTEAKPNNTNITLMLDKNAGNYLVCYGGVYNATQSTTTISKIWWS